MKANPLAGFLESVEVRMIRPPRVALRTDSGPIKRLMLSILDKIDSLSKLRRKIEREETNPSRLSLIS